MYCRRVNETRITGTIHPQVILIWTRSHAQETDTDGWGSVRSIVSPADGPQFSQQKEDAGALLWATWREMEEDGSAGFKWGHSVTGEPKFPLEGKKFSTSAVGSSRRHSLDTKWGFLLCYHYSSPLGLIKVGVTLIACQFVQTCMTWLCTCSSSSL